MALDFTNAWCVEERAVARLKAQGRVESKKRRRNIGRAIRYWQKKLARGSRSISVPIVGKVVLQKGGRPVEITYEPFPPQRVTVVDEYVQITERQIAAALGGRAKQ